MRALFKSALAFKELESNVKHLFNLVYAIDNDENELQGVMFYAIRFRKALIKYRFTSLVFEILFS